MLRLRYTDTPTMRRDANIPADAALACYLTLVDPAKNHSKFWLIYVCRCVSGITGWRCVTRYGRIGNVGATTSKHYITRAAALDEANRLIDSKLAKGYRDVYAAAVTHAILATPPPVPLPLPLALGQRFIDLDGDE